MPPRKRSTSQPLTRQASKKTRLDQVAGTSSPSSATTFTADQIADISNAVATAVSQTLTNLPPPAVSSTPTPAIQFVPDPPVTAAVATTTQPTQSQISAPQSTQDLVEASTATVIQQLTGNTLLPAGDGSAGKTSKNPFILANVPLAHRVSEKVRKQIWANEYVDFSTLFNLQEMEGKYVLKFQNVEGGATVSMVLSVLRQTIRTIEQWTSAFNTFVAIYTEKHVSETPGLMKYSSIVRELAQLSANWRFYDENFRLLRQKDPLPCDQIHSELYLRAHLSKVKNIAATRASKKTNGDPFPKGFCWKFHNGQRCTGFSFKHQCCRCGNSHPISRCQQNPKQGNSNQAGERASTAKKSMPASSTNVTPHSN